MSVKSSVWGVFFFAKHRDESDWYAVGRVIDLKLALKDALRL